MAIGSTGTRAGDPWVKQSGLKGTACGIERGTLEPGDLGWQRRGSWSRVQKVKNNNSEETGAPGSQSALQKSRGERKQWGQLEASQVQHKKQLPSHPVCF